MSRTFDDFCGGFEKCGHDCPLYDAKIPCRETFDTIKEYLEKEEES